MNDELALKLLTAIDTLTKEVARLSTVVQAPSIGDVSIDDAGKLLGCKRAMVYRLLAQGRLQRGTKVGRTTRITKASVERLTQRQRRAAPRASGPQGDEG